MKVGASNTGAADLVSLHLRNVDGLKKLLMNNRQAAPAMSYSSATERRPLTQQDLTATEP